MYLIDTNVISELRKKRDAHAGLVTFFATASAQGAPLYLSSIGLGELQRGVARLRHRGDAEQAGHLQRWLDSLLADYAERILAFDAEAAIVWGELCAPDPAHALDKQVAAIALIHDLTVVTRNGAHFKATGVRIVNPFEVQATK